MKRSNLRKKSDIKVSEKKSTKFADTQIIAKEHDVLDSLQDILKEAGNATLDAVMESKRFSGKG